MDNLYGQRGCLCDLQQETRHLLVLILFYWKEGAATRPFRFCIKERFSKILDRRRASSPAALAAAPSPGLDLLVKKIVLHKGYLRSFYQLREYFMYSICKYFGN
jgi:hypothetical protein